MRGKKSSVSPARSGLRPRVTSRKKGSTKPSPDPTMPMVMMPESGNGEAAALHEGRRQERMRRAAFDDDEDHRDGSNAAGQQHEVEGGEPSRAWGQAPGSAGTGRS
jgi:hypothetical protein